ncbi:ABC transporter substrate-binding protein [Fundicoccus sp. Sow4_D5]|uniref:ABC transporter substrate-binding protein n=1 Tax=Fundicoccus sp. Sow4_D5 TaxID=3438782 RepID=UPI003F8EB351
MSKLLKLLVCGTCLLGAFLPSNLVVAAQAEDEAAVDLLVGVMPATDAAPIFWADEYGLFEEAGINVQVELFTNATHQQTSAQAQQIDVYMASLVEFLIAIENNPEAGAITTSTDGVFPVVVSPKYDGGKDVSIGLMEISVTNYVADLFLSDYALDKQFIAEVPLRIQMLLAGELDMAVLPEPMASNAQAQGLEKLLVSESDDFSPNVMIFNQATLSEEADKVAAFHQAYNAAVLAMEGQEEAVKALLLERIGLDESIQDLLVLPTYHLTRLPSEETVEAARVWLEQLLDQDITVPYDELVVEDYVSHD